jgi:hypothetical protein
VGTAVGRWYHLWTPAEVVELVDTQRSGRCARKGVRVRFPFSALRFRCSGANFGFAGPIRHPTGRARGCVSGPRSRQPEPWCPGRGLIRPETITQHTDCRRSFWSRRARASCPGFKCGSGPGVNPLLVFRGRERSVDCDIRDREAVRPAARRRSERRPHGPSYRGCVLPGGKRPFPPRVQAEGGGAVVHLVLE